MSLPDQLTASLTQRVNPIPTRSPNAIQFREACRVAPTVDVSLKITQKLSPEESAAQRLRVKKLLNNLKSEMQSKREAK